MLLENIKLTSLEKFAFEKNGGSLVNCGRRNLIVP